MRGIQLLAATAVVAALGGCHEVPSGPPHEPGAASPSRPRLEGFTIPGETRTGWIFSETGVPMPVTYEVHGGWAFFEGDIGLGPADRIAATREALMRQPEGMQPRKGVVVLPGGGRRWPNGTVPYEIASTLPSPSRVTEAMAAIEANNPSIHFVPRTTQTDYITVIPNSNGCAVTELGRVGGQQLVFLAGNCSKGSVIHELSHVLGMHHEQNRCDRDSYVQVLWSNIGSSTQYDKQCAGAADLFSYDEGSIMHYPAFDPNTNLQVLNSLRGLNHLMGQRNGQSATDILTVAFMYPPPPPPTLGFSVLHSGAFDMMIEQPGSYTFTTDVPPGPGVTYLWTVRMYDEFYEFGTDPTLTLSFICPQYYDGVTVRATVTLASGLSGTSETSFAVDTRQAGCLGN